MNIYVGSLDFKVKEQQLEQAFAAYGDVTSVRIITDKVTRRSKGFAFVEMANEMMRVQQSKDYMVLLLVIAK
jgi:RNA recognition motif-containing protein